MRIKYRKEKIVLILGWETEFTGTIAKEFEKKGFITICKPGPGDFLKGEKFEKEELAKAFKEIGVDIVFTFNYYIYISETCLEAKIPYIAWIFDSPWTQVFNKSIKNECNHIFVFDRNLYNMAALLKTDRVHYLPMATIPNKNVSRKLRESVGRQWYDVSFVGAMYYERNEDKIADEILKNTNNDTRGFIEGLLETQRELWDSNIMFDSMEDDVIKNIINADVSNEKIFWKTDDVDSIDITGAKYDFAESPLSRKLTSFDRTTLIEAVGKRFGITLFTRDGNYTPEGIINKGQIQYGETAGEVFTFSRINLNITLRSIHTGIPLRVFDIMGSGGFALSDYQADYEGLFEPGVDMDYFHSKDEMLDKIEYYLSHEKERAEIAENGYRKVCSEHTFKQRIEYMLSFVN